MHTYAAFIISEKGGEIMAAEIIRNLNKHRVCDRSYDKKTVTIKDGNCLTIIKASPDGTLNIEHKLLAA